MARPKQTHCKRGHLYTEQTTRYRDKENKRSCKLCASLLEKRKYRKDKKYRTYKLAKNAEYRLQQKGNLN